MPVKKLLEYLDSNAIDYVTIHHSKAFTAQKVAAASHIPGKEIAKTVMVKADEKMIMAVLPASFKINFNLLKEAIGANIIELASEREFKDLFPDCDVGAMPPFGNLYNLDVFVAESLAEDKEIAFSGGTHTELIKLSFKDYQRLVQPRILKFSKKG